MGSSSRLGASEFASQVEQVERQTYRVTDALTNFRFFLAILFIALGLALNAAAPGPPPPRICGTLHGPPVTASRIRLPDGRPLAYHQSGVDIRNAKHKVVFVHDYGKSRLEILQWSSKQEFLEELGVYLVSYDRAGYGESHPFPHRSVESEVSDIEHLAYQLGLGPKFHVLAVGVGTYAAWGCLKYIPHRLEGVAIVSPVVNFWWPGLPQAQTRKSFHKLDASRRNLVRLVHYAPQLLHWWTTQTWLPSEDLFRQEITEVAVQQGVHESLHKDLIVQFGQAKFGPTELQRPIFSSNFSVQVWFPDEEDAFFPAGLQNYFKQKLHWIEFFHHDNKKLDGLHQIFNKLVGGGSS